jgi:hypothetical protein
MSEEVYLGTNVARSATIYNTSIRWLYGDEKNFILRS